MSQISFSPGSIQKVSRQFLCDVKAPTSFPTTAEKMGFPDGDAAQLVHFFHALQKSQHLAELVHDTGGKPLRAVFRVKALDTFMDNVPYLHPCKL
jgi:hypothetical protein